MHGASSSSLEDPFEHEKWPLKEKAPCPCMKRMVFRVLVWLMRLNVEFIILLLPFFCGVELYHISYGIFQAFELVDEAWGRWRSLWSNCKNQWRHIMMMTIKNGNLHDYRTLELTRKLLWVYVFRHGFRVNSEMNSFSA